MKRRRDGEERRGDIQSLSCLSLHQSQQDTTEDGEDESVLMDGLKAICKTEEASQTAFLQDASDIGCTSTRRGIFEKDITTEEKGIKEKKHHSIWDEKEGGEDGDEVLVIRVLLFLI